MFDKKLILASKSPRRFELLSPHFASVLVKVQNVKEVFASTLPEDIVKELANLKLGVLPKEYPNDLVISGDTIVWHEGKVLGKPKNEQDAFYMLKSLSGKSHQVYSGYAISYKGKVVVGADCCNVKFKNLTDSEIVDYIKTGSPLDKAGAYGIQDGVVVESFSGDLNTVIGLPLNKILKDCKELIANE